jgi:endonuclease-3
VNPAKRLEIFRRLKQANPAPRTELVFSSPFELLVAVILSAQATDKGVNKATARLYRTANTPAAIGKLGVAGLSPYIKSIGLYNAKAKNIIATCQALIERHGGEVPATRAELEALPGVGRKTANVVLNEVFGHATMAVDTHIFRLGNRTGIAPGNSPREVENGLLKRVPAPMLKPAHLWLILHGRYICKARSPECWRCPGKPYCVFKPKTLAPLPAKARSESAKKRPVG